MAQWTGERVSGANILPEVPETLKFGKGMGQSNGLALRGSFIIHTSNEKAHCNLSALYSYSSLSDCSASQNSRSSPQLSNKSAAKVICCRPDVRCHLILMPGLSCACRQLQSSACCKIHMSDPLLRRLWKC